MSRVRLFVAWLILAALPLQGLAAASMLLCQPGDTAQASPVAGPHHDAPALQASQDSSEPQAMHAHHAADAFGDAGQLQADHQCGVCAMCGHAMALAASVASSEHRSAPQAHLFAPSPRIDSRAQPVPDKPPRA